MISATTLPSGAPAKSVRAAVGVRLAAGAAALVGLSAAALAQPADEPPPPSAPAPFLVFEHVPLRGFFVDPRDQAFADAVAMVPERIGELPHEIPDMPPEAAALLRTILETAARPGRLAAFYDEFNVSGGAFGYGLVLSIDLPDQAAADHLHAQVAASLAAAEVRLPSRPSSDWPGLVDVPTPFGVLRYGPRQADDGWKYQVMFGTVEDPDAKAAPVPVPGQGFTPIVLGRFDFAGLTGLTNMLPMAAGQQPEVAEVHAWLEAVGLTGPEAMSLTLAAGYTEEDQVTLTVLERAGPHNGALNIPTEPLRPDELAAVPADATMAYLARGDLSFLERAIDNLTERQPEVGMALAQFHDMTGVDLRNELLPSLGGAFGLYCSDATGGGGLGSTVAMLGLRDREQFMQAHGKLVAFANAMADRAPAGPGYIRLASWQQDGTDLMSLRFPGLPIPLEITYALTDRWLLLAGTPQGALAAARQATGAGDDGLRAHPALAASLPDQPITSLSFVDSARHLRRGYVGVTLIGSLVANLVRGPGGQREPGMVVPAYHDLARDLRPMVKYSYWRGDDFVTEAHADRSTLANLGAGLGAIGEVMPLAMLGAIGAAAQEHHVRIDSPADAARLLAMLREWGPSMLAGPEPVVIAAAAMRLVEEGSQASAEPATVE